jgi:ribosome-binding factor A
MRIQRISERMREELSEMLIREISDPRLAGITVTEVEVDRELAYAKIYVSAIEGVSRSEEVLGGLEHAQGFIRRELAQRINLRSFPRLKFHWDPTMERAETIERLINSIHLHENDPNNSSTETGWDSLSKPALDSKETKTSNEKNGDK